MANLEEIWKRKRDEEKEEEVEKGQGGGGNRETDKWMFKESMLIGRSPEKKKERKEEGGGMGEVKELIREMNKNLGGKMERMDTNMKLLGKDIRREMEQLREEMRRREEEWIEQKRDLEGKMEKMMKKMEEIERREGEDERWKEIEERMLKATQDATGSRREESRGGKIEEKLKEIERKLERKEKEERRKNIIIKGTKTKREEMKEKAEEILKVTGVEGAIEEVKAVGPVEKGKELYMMQVKVKTVELKRKIMENKRALKGREERIEDDLTWEERRTQWTLRRIARGEREKGKNVWVDSKKIRIEGKWWKWDDDKGVLMDGEGNEWKPTQEGEQKKGEEGKGT
ncbi:vicilin-like seed storage protein At2g18540 [Osmia bicornis bicornis]|uniref:vicilin-like seed storage protein At2g18540 n=1 Tax=Osmia bicornis bicornis TaxID=1437191 RepID=UPI001EAEF07A|nr:vicilin-like seed storage protein At2g18540 [Osmia bicornis bicornis]